MKNLHQQNFTRGSLSKTTGVNIETIRFFEKLGLMPDPPRSSNGYRCYSEEHVKRLKFIRRSRELGFTNNEVKGLLEMVDGIMDCESVRLLAVKNTEMIACKVADLRNMQTVLEAMALECKKNETPDCPIVERLLNE